MMEGLHILGFIISVLLTIALWVQTGEAGGRKADADAISLLVGMSIASTAVSGLYWSLLP